MFERTWRSRVVRPSAHDWKSCIPQKGIEGSNPSFSAIESLETSGFQGFLFAFYPLFTLYSVQGRLSRRKKWLSVCLRFFGILDVFLHPIRGILPHLLRHVTVYIQCEAHRGMAEISLDGLDIIPALQRYNGVAMT